MLNRLITFHQNKEEEFFLKTLGKDKADEEEEEERHSPPPLPLKRKVTSTLTTLTKKLKGDVAKDKTIKENPPHSKKVVSKMIPPEKNISLSHASDGHPLSPLKTDDPPPPPPKDKAPPPPSL